MFTRSRRKVTLASEEAKCSQDYVKRERERERERELISVAHEHVGYYLCACLLREYAMRCSCLSWRNNADLESSLDIAYFESV